LIAAQEGHDELTLVFEPFEKGGSHTLAIHHDAGVALLPGDLFIEPHNLFQSFHHMPIAPTCQDQQGMTMPIMQEHQPTTPQNFTRATNQTAREQLLAMDRFAVPIHIAIIPGLLGPQLIGPSSQGPGEAQGSIPAGKSQENPFQGPISIGQLSSCQQTESIPAVAAQISGAT